MIQKAQWTLEIVVGAALERVWEIAEDIALIPRYHHQVDRVDLISGQVKRAVGVKYQCNISQGSRAGSCIEEVTGYEPERMVVTRMVSDSWGIDKMLANFSVETTVSRRTETSTVLRLHAFYEPVGFKNRILNALFLRRVIRRRSLAVMKGIKAMVEAPRGEPMP